MLIFHKDLVFIELLPINLVLFLEVNETSLYFNLINSIYSIIYLFSLNIDFSEKSRETPPKISLRRTSLEGFCPPRDQPFCTTTSRRYRTHDGTCNNGRKGRWGAAQMPFNRFQSPAYNDGIEEIRESVFGGPLPSPRLVSLLVHGSRESESPVTLMLAQWGQFIDHDLTATLQPR